MFLRELLVDRRIRALVFSLFDFFKIWNAFFAFRNLLIGWF